MLKRSEVHLIELFGEKTWFQETEYAESKKTFQGNKQS
jgi:hypothetical protein